MDFRFHAEEWSSLTPTERARRCRLLADEAQQLADSALSPELKKSYQQFADQWAQLAREIEQQIKP